MPKLDLDQIKTKREKVSAQLAELKAAEQAELDRRAAVVGHAILAAIESDDDLNAKVRAILDQRLKKKRDRLLFDLPAKT